MSTTRIPKLCQHRAKQLGYVTLSGREFYFGHWPLKSRRPPPSVQAEYQSLIATWLANGKSMPEERPAFCINDIILKHLEWAEGHFPHDGRENTQLRLTTDALRVVKELFGRTPTIEFGPKKLRVVRDKMVEKGWARSVVNAQVNRVKRLFRWAASEEMIGGEVYATLRTVDGLRKGCPGVRETDPVRPVPMEVVDATLPHLSATLRTMVQVQLASGMRPGEVCLLRAADIDRTSEVWIYTPEKHKTQHHGHARRVLFGPRAQQFLQPYLDAAGDDYLFSPRRSEAARNAERREERRSKMTPSQRGRKPKADPKRPKGDRYTVLSYRNAVYRAADKAFPPLAPLVKRVDETAAQWKARLSMEEVEQIKKWRSEHRWTVNQLRHLAGTTIRREFGVETARTVLGHRRLNTTEIYAEADVAKASEAVAVLG